MEDDLNRFRGKAQNEKVKRRNDLAREVEKSKLLECEMTVLLNDIDEWLHELAEELRDAQRETKAALKGKERQESVAAKRLMLLEKLKANLGKTRDHVADQSNQQATLERMATIGIQIKKERALGWKGGSGRRPVHFVMLICELLSMVHLPLQFLPIFKHHMLQIKGGSWTNCPHLLLFGSAVLLCRI